MAAALGGEAGTREARVSAVGVRLHDWGTLGSPPSHCGGRDSWTGCTDPAAFRRAWPCATTLPLALLPSQ